MMIRFVLLPLLLLGVAVAPATSSRSFDGEAIIGDLGFAFELAVDERLQQVEVDSDARVTTGDSQPHKIVPGAFNFGRGVGYVAAERVRAGEPLFALPMHRVMSLESAARGRIGALLRANPELPPAIALALHLLEERALGARSNFSAIVDTLPTTTAALNSTLFYSREQLAMLEGSQLLRVVASRATALDHYYRALVEPLTTLVVDPPLFAPHEFTLASFRWALGVVWSHAFPIGLSERDIVLAPVLSTIAVCSDSAQCPAKNRLELPPHSQRLVVRAGREYAAGEEVELFIGDKSSTLLMANHGFARAKPSSTLDQVDIAIVVDTADPLADVKAFLLRSQNMSMNDTHALRLSDPLEFPADMVTSLKIKLLTGGELRRYKDLLGPVKNPKEPYTETRHIVGLRNEFAFTRALLQTCSNLLAQYRTTLEQDELALNDLHRGDRALASREAQILRTLVLEKRILHATMARAQEQWAALVLSDHPNLLRIDDE
ncbi:hypothetical protein PybrP1_000545 [[Pythium] brassicae (nom. inval.)]|nr:hypothetical protein PybrP1_000545 [[Pythium] brassicae (nom. inval.)]